VALFVAEDLVDDGTQAHELVVEATLTIAGEDPSDPGDLAVSGVTCHLRGRVPGTTAERFAQVGTNAMARCVRTLAIRDSLPAVISSTLIS
jgi:hypothetical protein